MISLVSFIALRHIAFLASAEDQVVNGAFTFELPNMVGTPKTKAQAYAWAFGGRAASPS